MEHVRHLVRHQSKHLTCHQRQTYTNPTCTREDATEGSKFVLNSVNFNRNEVACLNKMPCLKKNNLIQNHLWHCNSSPCLWGIKYISVEGGSLEIDYSAFTNVMKQTQWYKHNNTNTMTKTKTQTYTNTISQIQWHKH